MQTREPDLVSLFPHPSPPLPPRIEHAVASRSGAASEIIAEELGVSCSFARELIEFGGVYHCEEVPPKPEFGKEGSGGKGKKRARDQTEADFQSQLKRTRPIRILLDALVAKGGYFRVHLHPKRFPSVYEVDWKGRVLDDGAEWVVVNKPAGVSVNPTVDNFKENTAACVASALGRDSALIVTHRLDVATSGVLVLAKTSAFAKFFHNVLALRRVHKTYRTLTHKPVPIGIAKHRAVQADSDGGPRFVHMLPMDSGFEDVSGAECSLEVLKCSEVRLTCANLPETAFETEVRLITGRTHQIRAQFAALGAPLYGDTLYSGNLTADRVAPGPGDSIGLQAWKLEVDDAVMGETGTKRKPTISAKYIAPAKLHKHIFMKLIK